MSASPETPAPLLVPVAFLVVVVLVFATIAVGYVGKASPSTTSGSGEPSFTVMVNHSSLDLAGRSGAGVSRIDSTVPMFGAEHESTALAETANATIPVGSDPIALSYDNTTGDVFVTNYGSNDVSVISDTTNTVVATVKVGGSPQGMTYDPAASEVLVTNWASDTVSVISTANNTLVGTVDVGIAPLSVLYESGNQSVYVMNTQSDNVTVIRGTAVLGSVSLPGNPGYAAYNGRNGYVYVSIESTSSVCAISGITVVGCVNVGSDPTFITYDGGNGDVYVTNSGSDNVSVISGTAVIASVSLVTSDIPRAPVGSGAIEPTVGGNPDQPALRGPWFSAYDPNDGYVYVTNRNTASVTSISGTSVVGVVHVGTDPSFVTVDSGNGYVYVLNGGSANVSVIRNVSLVGSVEVGSGPVCAAYDSGTGYVYVANDNSADVSVIELVISASTPSWLLLALIFAVIAVPLTAIGAAAWFRRK